MGGRDPHGYGWPVPVTTALPELHEPSVDVAVVDAGIGFFRDKPHPWLERHVRFRETLDVEHDDGSDVQINGHGTFVAGVLLRHAPMARVHLRRAIVVSEEADTDVAAAIRDFGRTVKLINLSFGGGIWEHRTPLDMKAALDELDPDVVVVAAAANNALPLRTYPAAEPNVLAVGATTAAGGVAEFSAFGEWIDVYTDGQDVLGPYRDGAATWSGTSFAAAAITGKIANLMSAGLTAVAARDRLLRTAERRKVFDINGERTILVV